MTDEIMDPEDPFKDCPKGKLNCIYHDEFAESEENKIQMVVCRLAPCFTSRFELAIHEEIIEYYLDEENYHRAYYFFQNLLDKHRFDCNLAELERIKRENPNYTLADLPPACRIFSISHQLKELKDSIKDLKETIRKQKAQEKDLCDSGQETLNISRNKFKRKINSAMQLLRHIIMDEEYKKGRKQGAHERSIEKVSAMGEAGFNFTMKGGKEVGIDNDEDEAILYADHPRFQERKGIFAREQAELEKQEKEQQKKKKEDSK